MPVLPRCFVNGEEKKLPNLFGVRGLLSAVSDGWKGAEVEWKELRSTFPSKVSDLERATRLERLSRGLGIMLVGRLPTDPGVLGPGIDVSELDIACLWNLSLPL